jgi:pilus assembly protein CpaB
MKWTIAVVAALGLVAALCAAVLVAFLTAQPTVKKPAVEEEVTILVVARDIPQLTMVDAASIEVQLIPRHLLPADALTMSVQAVGKILAVSAVKGQALRKAMFVTEGAGAQLAASLPEGRRAVAISVSDSGGLDGILYPGSVVDVILTVRGNGGEVKGAARLVLERVVVLAVDMETVVAKNAELPPGNPRLMGEKTRRIALLVDPRQASEVELAQAEGVLSLALRNPLDRRAADRTTVSISNLLPPETARPSLLERTAINLARGLKNVKPSAAPHNGDSPLVLPVTAPTAIAAATSVETLEADPPTSLLWHTIILHGTQVEKLEFPMGPYVTADHGTE